MPLFLAATGLVMLAGRLLSGETSRWDAGAAGTLAYAIVFPNALGYVLWEWAMRKGDVALLAAASYALPLVSTLFACWLLQTPVHSNLLVGALLVVTGAVLSRSGVVEKAQAVCGAGRSDV